MIGNRNAINASPHKTQQPIPWRYGFIAPVVFGRRRVGMKIETPPARAGPIGIRICFSLIHGLAHQYGWRRHQLRHRDGTFGLGLNIQALAEPGLAT